MAGSWESAGGEAESPAAAPAAHFPRESRRALVRVSCIFVSSLSPRPPSAPGLKERLGGVSAARESLGGRASAVGVANTSLTEFLFSFFCVMDRERKSLL